MARPSCKDKILEAADAVALELGANRLTLDAVAERADVSKGGVLYHFPTKESLLVGMVARHIENARARRHSCPEQCSGPGAALKVDVLSTLHRTQEENRVSAALLAAVANEPKLLGPALAFHRERFAALAGSGDDEQFARKALISLAADGLYLLELIQVAPFSPAQRKALVETLLKMSDEACASESAHEA